jgi:hypothetical protein
MPARSASNGPHDASRRGPKSNLSGEASDSRTVDHVARVGVIARSSREATSPLGVVLYICHPRLVNGYPRRSRGSPAVNATRPIHDERLPAPSPMRPASAQDRPCWHQPRPIPRSTNGPGRSRRRSAHVGTERDDPIVARASRKGENGVEAVAKGAFCARFPREEMASHTARGKNLRCDLARLGDPNIRPILDFRRPSSAVSRRKSRTTIHGCIQISIGPKPPSTPLYPILFSCQVFRRKIWRKIPRFSAASDSGPGVDLAGF